MPTEDQYVRAHQYLYHVMCKPVLSDYDYDKPARHRPDQGKGGSDLHDQYIQEDIELALAILNGKAPIWPW